MIAHILPTTWHLQGFTQCRYFRRN